MVRPVQPADAPASTSYPLFSHFWEWLRVVPLGLSLAGSPVFGQGRPPVDGTKPQSETKKKLSSTTKTVASRATPAAATPETKKIDPVVPRRSTQRDGLEALLDGNLPTARPPQPARSPGYLLEEQLTVDEIRFGMRAVRPQVLACREKHGVPGIAYASLVIGKDGAVKSVEILGNLAGTPTGDCAAAAVRAARFPQFLGNDMSVKWPFVLR